VDLVKLECGFIFGQSHWFFLLALNKSQVNIAACRILVAGTLQATPVLQAPCIAERPTGRRGLCLKGLWAFWTLNALRSVLRQLPMEQKEQDFLLLKAEDCLRASGRPGRHDRLRIRLLFPLPRALLASITL
jgi:hypothetical protein